MLAWGRKLIRSTDVSKGSHRAPQPPKSTRPPTVVARASRPNRTPTEPSVDGPHGNFASQRWGCRPWQRCGPLAGEGPSEYRCYDLSLTSTGAVLPKQAQLRQQSNCREKSVLDIRGRSYLLFPMTVLENLLCMAEQSAVLNLNCWLQAAAGEANGKCSSVG